MIQLGIIENDLDRIIPAQIVVLIENHADPFFQVLGHRDLGFLVFTRCLLEYFALSLAMVLSSTRSWTRISISASVAPLLAICSRSLCGFVLVAAAVSRSSPEMSASR